MRIREAGWDAERMWIIRSRRRRMGGDDREKRKA